MRAMKYKYKVIIWGKVNGKPTIIGRDRAMSKKVGESGDLAFELLKNKKILPYPEIQTGRNTYWFTIRSDQEWINVGIADIDEASRELKLEFTDQEMRYARTSLQGNLKERFIVKNFLDQYRDMIMNIGYIAIIGIMIWLMMDKWLELSQVLNQGISQVPEILDRIEDLLIAMENVESGGSGFTQANG